MWTEQLPYKLPLQPLIALLLVAAELGVTWCPPPCEGYQCRHPQMPCAQCSGGLNISAAMNAPY